MIYSSVSIIWNLCVDISDSFTSYIIGAFGVLRWIYSQIDCPIDLSTEYTEATERFVIPLREYNLELMS